MNHLEIEYKTMLTEAEHTQLLSLSSMMSSPFPNQLLY